MLQRKDYQSAVSAYEFLLSDARFSAPAALRLSLIAGQFGGYRRSVEYAMAAFRSRVPDIDLLDMLCKRLSMLGENQAAEACAEEILRLPVESAGTPAEVGKVMTDAMAPELALRLFAKARASGLDSPGMRYLVGMSQMYAGNLEEAERELESALVEEPQLAQAHWVISKLRRYSPNDNHLNRLNAAIAGAGKNTQDACLLHYALFKELDDLGRIDDAWIALERGMRIRKKLVPFDGKVEAELFDFLLEEEASVADQTVETADGGASGSAPIFIVGLPRSGTTLLEVMLGNHPEVASCGELNDAVMQLRWMCDLGGAPHLDVALAHRARGVDPLQYGQRYLAHTRWRASGKRYYTDKMPENFMMLGYLAKAIPEARFIHIHRDPMDACFSNLKELFAAAYPYSYDLLDMADHYARYRKLMSHWHQKFPARVLDVRYEDLVLAPSEAMRRICSFCDLAWDEAVVDGSRRTGTIATASTTQVREPVHGRFVAQWRRYERYLAPMQKRLERQIPS